MVRASNQASAALRRVAGDVRGLKAITGLKQARAQLAINERNILTQRQAMKNEMDSIATGRRRASLDRAALSQQLAMNRAKLASANVGVQTRNLEEAQIKNQVRMSRLNRSMIRASERFGIGSTRWREYAALLDAARMRAATMNRQFELLEDKAGIARGAITKQNMALRELAGREADAAHRQQVLNERMTTSTQRLALNAQKMRDVNKAISAARWDRLGMAGRTIQHMGRIVAYAGIVMGASLGYAAHQAAQFETQAQLVGTQMGKIGNTAAQSAKLGTQLGKAILQILPETTSNVDELTQAAYDLFSSLDSAGKGFLTLKDGVKLLRLMGQAAIAGQTDIATATDGTISVMNAFGISVKDMPKTLNRLFAGVRFGRMTFAEFAKTLSVTAPAAKAAGQSLDTMVGTMAFLTRRLDVNKAAIGFARLTEILSRKKMIEGLHDAGVEITDTNGQFKQMPEMIEAIVRKFPALQKGGKTLAQFFKTMSGTEGTIMARRAFVFLAQQTGTYRNILNRTTRDNTEFTKSLGAMEQSTGVRWAKMVNQFKAFALMIGAAVIPQLLKLQPYIERVTEWFKNLDEETRNKYAKWATYAAGIALVGSAFLFIGGIVIQILAKVGALTGSLGFLVAGFVAVSIAIDALHGEWNGLNGVIDRFVNFGTGSLKGWIVMLGLGAIAATKMAGAFRTMMLMTAGQAYAGGITGMVAGMTLGARNMTNAFRAMKASSAAAGAGMLKANLAGSAAALAAMGISIPVVVGGILTAGVAALAWKQHMKHVREEQEKMMAEYNRFMGDTRRMTSAAKQLGGLGAQAREAKGAALDIKELRLQLKELNRQRIGMKPGFGRDMLDINIERTKLSLADAKDRLRSLQGGATSAFTAVQRFLVGYANVGSRISKIQSEITRKQKQLAAARAGRVGVDDVAAFTTITRLERQIAGLRGNLTRLQSDAGRAGAILAASFDRAVKSLQRAAMLPAKLGPDAIRAAFRYFTTGAAKLTPRNLRVFFRAYLDPKSNVRGQIQKAAAAARGRDIKFKATVDAAHAKLTLKKMQEDRLIQQGMTMKVNPDPQAKGKAASMWSAVDAITKKPHQINVIPPPNLAGIGANISAGIEAGLHPITQDVVQRTIKDPWTKGLGIRSPSRWMAQNVGLPISEGIAMGVVEGIPKLERVAALSANLFAGAWIQSLQQKMGDKYDPLKAAKLEARASDLRIKAAKKGASELTKVRAKEAALSAKKYRRINVSDLIKDTRLQAREMKLFNDSMARLTARHLPKQLLDELAALGVEGAQYLALLAGASKKELAAFVKEWRKVQREIKRSQRATVEGTKEWRDNMKQYVDDAAQNLLDKWNEINDMIKSQYGDLFSNIDPATYGQGYIDAMKEWTEKVADVEKQLSDLYKELDDLYAERNKLIDDYNTEVKQIKADWIAQQIDKLRSAFGELFSGDLLQQKKEWAATISFDDILKDLQGQLTSFNRWRASLDKIAGRGVPQQLMDQLEALGPDATSMLEALGNATDEELAQYLKTWVEAEDMFKSIAERQALTSEELGKQLAEALARFTEAMSDIGTRISDVLGKINDVAKELRKILEEQPKALTGQEILEAIRKQIEAWDRYQRLLQELRDRGLPEEIIAQLAALGPEALPMLEALVAMTDEQLFGPGGFVELWTKSQQQITDATDQLMRDQLQMWYEHGANIAAAIIAGTASEQEALLAFFRKLFINLLEGRYTDYTPPDPGEYTGPGSGPRTGVGPRAPGTGYPPEGPYIGTLPSSYASRQGTTVNMTVNAQDDQSLMSTLETASFRLGTRNVE